MTKITINDQCIEVSPNTTILEACQQIGIEIPYFCYHPQLSIAGNCRMCLVEVEKSVKPIASCHTYVTENMVIHTHTEKAQQARKNILELLLINHPLDCPICDQGGQCDLQDLTLHYGPSQSHFLYEKRTVTDKYFGPLIKTHMTRCIHCTRCIRFSDEISGTSELGTSNRGETMEIINILGTALRSELSGNMIDICPVGALTEKPYAYKGRPWEWQKTKAIDVMDALGSHIEIHSRGQEIFRIKPRFKEDINESWISDRSRFSYDGLKHQRLDRPYKRVEGKLHPCSWEDAFTIIQDQLTPLTGSQIAALTGDLVDCESALALKTLWNRLGSFHLDCRQDKSLLPYKHRCHYVMNTPLVDFESTDCILMVGCNPRYEAPLLNIRIRKNYLKNHIPIGLIGESIDLTYPYYSICNRPEGLALLLQEDHPFSRILKAAKNPTLLLGQSVFNRSDTPAMLSAIQKLIDQYSFIKENWNGYNVLHIAASRVGSLDIGFVPDPQGYTTEKILQGCQQGDIQLIYLLGADEIDINELGNAFVIYQGYHGESMAQRADIILPGCAYSEKTATYVNTEGRAQRSDQSVSPIGDAKEDWRIITALSRALKDKLALLGNSPLHYIRLEDVQKDLEKCHSVFLNLHNIVKNPWISLPTFPPSVFNTAPLESHIKNFYMTNSITRHSQIMASCVREIVNQQPPLISF